jgi:predicted N-formylglutamate amidohydrolase
MGPVSHPNSMTASPPAPVDLADVLETTVFRGTRARSGAPFDLLIEVPHGATRTAEFAATAALLRSPLPTDLVDFFHVNTDAGAPELALATAQRFVAAAPDRSALVMRCRIPRTFIDCNRRIDASPEDFKAGRVTPGLMPWVTAPEDRALLRARAAAYFSAVGQAFEALPRHARMLLLHTYAPRSVGVDVDLDIVRTLHEAYAPDVLETWPLRPHLDVIAHDPEGRALAPAGVVAQLRASLGAQDLVVADGETYPLHPSTQAHAYAVSRPGYVLCLEVRRDLLADPFEPFAEMRIGSTQVARLARPLAGALLHDLGP